MARPKNLKGGRPLIEINEKLLQTLTRLHLSDKVIAHCVGCSVDTLERRFADKMEIWRSESKGKIAEVLFDEAINKREPWALKTISQRHLGYADKVEQVNKSEVKISSDESKQKLEQLKTMLKDEV